MKCLRNHSLEIFKTLKLKKYKSGSLERYITTLVVITVVYYAAPQRTFWPQPSKFSPKKTSIFSKKSPRTFQPQPSKIFPKKFLIFFLKKSCSEKLSYIFSKKPPNFQETELSYISRKIYLEPQHIQNLVDLKPKTY